MKREEASRNGGGRRGKDESKGGTRKSTRGSSLPVQSNERKMSSRGFRWGSSNSPPCPMAGPLARESGLDEASIWEWGFIERVSSGLYIWAYGSRELGQPFF